MARTKKKTVEIPAIAVQGEGDGRSLEGTLDVHTLDQAREALGGWLGQRKARTLDIAGLEGLDTSGAMFLCDLREHHVAIEGASEGHRGLLDLIEGLERKPLPKPRASARWRQFVMQIGKGADDFCRDAYAVIVFVARALNAIVYTLIHPSLLRPASISRQVLETGINALPIVGLMAVMIAVVIGYQGVAQLRPFGGEELMINLVAVSVVREMGVLITAIMVAGRSGSAFTAEIGVMKAREEIDALKVMGLGPMELLVVPRLIGLVIALPLLTFFADVMGLIGGGISAHSLLQVAPAQYIDRVRQALDTNDLYVGLVKAPIFAFFIGIVGCMHGLRVGGSAESIGRETTRAVVKGIFLVIIFDALFSVLFEKLGL